MIPSGFVILDTLPLTPNDKVDRRALPKPDKTNLNLEEEYLSARNEVEQKLVALWEQVFSIQPIGIKDNFFSLGGNSLMATSMVVEIEKIFNKKLSQAIFFKASTIEELAAIISQIEIASEIVIKSNVKIPPLFVIANIGYLYQQMIEYLETEQPMYIIQEPLDIAPEMASRCLQRMREIQPQGPYHLMGHSYEGLVAYEIAGQLYKEKEQVAFLGLLDTAIPELENLADKTSRQKRYQRLKKVFQLPPIDIINFFKERIEYRMSKKFDPLLSSLEKFTNAYDEIKQLPVKITIFAAIFEFYGLEDANLGWDKFAIGGVEVYEIPGTHRSMVLKADNAKLIAKQLRDCLRK